MKTEVNPQDTCRAEAFGLWMASPMPMVTVVKTMDVGRLRRVSRKTGIKFNVLLCWCIGKAASGIDEFYLLPEGLHPGEDGEGRNGHLYRFDKLAINVIVLNRKWGITLCDVPYCDDVGLFNAGYLEITGRAAETCQGTSLDDCMVIGTSAMVATELDCIVNQYSGIFNNPFLAWGKYRCHQDRTTLPISFQFHHVQMDGGQAALFLEELQKTLCGKCQ